MRSRSNNHANQQNDKGMSVAPGRAELNTRSWATGSEGGNVSVVIGLLMTLALTTTTPAKPSVAVQRLPIFVQSNAVDPVGTEFVRKLRAALDTSTIYRPVKNPADAQYVIGIVTMDPDDAAVGSGAGTSTVASVTLQLENTKGLNHFIYSWVLVANEDKVQRLAVELFAAIDREIQDLNAQISR